MPEEALQKLSVIVPCFNEELNSYRFRKEVIEPFQNFPFKTEFIFIDDGSTDKTASILRSLINSEPLVKVYSHELNKGLGAAIKKGFTHATGDAVLVLDADLTFHPAQFPLIYEKWGKDVDCVTGSPVKGRFQGVPFFRRLMSIMVNSMYQKVLRFPISSTSSIFRLYRKNVLDQFSFECESFDINAEIVSKLIITGHQVIEVPVILTDRFMGQSKINVIREIKNHFRMFAKILYWKISLRHGKK